MKNSLISGIICLLLLSIALIFNRVGNSSVLSQELLQESLPNISRNWEAKSFLNYYSGSDSNEAIEQLLSRYSQFGKLVSCPSSSDNSMEVSFFNTQIANISVVCDFEYVRAIIRASINVNNNSATYTKFEIYGAINHS